jgi:hypothetical protein
MFDIISTSTQSYCREVVTMTIMRWRANIPYISFLLSGDATMRRQGSVIGYVSFRRTRKKMSLKSQTTHQTGRAVCNVRNRGVSAMVGIWSCSIIAFTVEKRLECPIDQWLRFQNSEPEQHHPNNVPAFASAPAHTAAPIPCFKRYTEVTENAYGRLSSELFAFVKNVKQRGFKIGAKVWTNKTDKSRVVGIFACDAIHDEFASLLEDCDQF